MSRKLATIRVIDELLPIDGADRIELAIIDGWQVVVKKGEFKVGSLVIYCEVDSFIPNSVAPYLTREGKEPRNFKGVVGERLRTVKLRGELSQGLVLSLDSISDENFINISHNQQEGSAEDVTDILGIIKWEKEFKQFRGGNCQKPKGNFPSLVPKTDQERIQNLSKKWDKYQDNSLTWEVTEKLEGSSCTFYLDNDGNFEVCSRNLSLQDVEGCKYWFAAKKYNIESKMKDLNLTGVALQGELVGPGIQGNIYNLTEVDFYLYDIYDVNKSGYLTSLARLNLFELLGLKHVPVLEYQISLQNVSVKELLAMAECKSSLNPVQEREGLVFKCNEKPELSFKVISNKYLLKEK